VTEKAQNKEKTSTLKNSYLIENEPNADIDAKKE
jgi:hypothetical protein